MVDHAHLDGNSIAGILMEVFGREMTAQLGQCSACGSVRAFGEVRVYGHAPGHVLRCPVCGKVLMVIVRAGVTYRVSVGTLSSPQVSDDGANSRST